MTVRKTVKKPRGKVRVKKAVSKPIPSPEFSDTKTEVAEPDESADVSSEEVAPEPEPKSAPKKKATKKTASKKPAAKKTATKPAAKKTPAKKSAAKTSKKKAAAERKPATKKSATKKAASKKADAAERKPNTHNWEKGPGGYRAGSNSAIAVEEMLKGGEDRAEVGNRIAERCGPTRKGARVNASGMISSLMLELADQGYTVESSWVLKEPTPQSKSAATRARKKREKENG